MRVRLLGPVDVAAGDESWPVQGLRRKAVLATLALNAGEVVSLGRLMDAVWDGAAPPTAVNTLQSHMSNLRTLLGSRTAIIARPPGYMLDLGDESTDVQSAERLLREGARAASPALAAGPLREALKLWRGRPLADLAGLSWLEEQAGRLDLLWVRIRRALAQARLEAGEHLALVPDLEQMSTEYPLDEQVHSQLMLALYRSGRQADALSVYHRVRASLSDELGIDPGQPLRDLEVAILQQDPALDLPAGVAATAGPLVAVPAQLPPGVPAFAGRASELAALDAAVGLTAAPRPGGTAARGSATAKGTAASQAAAADQAAAGQDGAAGQDVQSGQVPVSRPGQPPVMVIWAVSGTAGVGKTALALHWSHRAVARFPDGQLYVNLRGFDSAGPAMDPGEVLHGFLEALGVPAPRIPPDVAARTGLYRSLLAGKRVLVLLDNARDADQARPLLPGSPGCLTVVTSRNQLSGLVAAECASPLALDLLPAADARELLARRLGAARVEAEAEAVDRIIERCARLPLALTLAAARASVRPKFSLAAVADELAGAGGAFDPLRGGDRSTDVRAVFSWSYQALSSGAAKMFRLLGLHPGPDLSAAAAASLAKVGTERAHGLLAELARAHMAAEPSPGRYACHDLLRAYAAELAQAHDSQDDRDAATGRLLDHYLHTAHAAAKRIEPWIHPVPPPPARPGAVVTELAGPQEALAWFAAEHTVLLAAVRLAAEGGYSVHTWQLACAMTASLVRRGLWEDQASVCQTGLHASRKAGDVTGEAHSLHFLGMGAARTGRFSDASPLLAEALSLFRDSGDHFAQGMVLSQLAWVAENRSPDDMLAYALRALAAYKRAGHIVAQMMALNDIGWCHAQLGNYPQALSYCERALTGLRALGDKGEVNWEAGFLHSLGYIHAGLGNHAEAVACYEESAVLSREMEDRFNEADTLASLGDLHERTGNSGAARQAWARAVHILDEIGHPDANEVRAKLGAQRRLTIVR